MIPLPEAELVLDAGAEVAEGPVWDADSGCLIWVDIDREAVHFFDPATGEDSVIPVGQSVGAVAARRSGGYVLALADGFGAVSVGGETTILAVVEDEVPENRMNDGKCDPGGRFFAGTMRRDFSGPEGTLYRLDPDLSVRTVLTDVWISNGLGWSPDGSRMYFIDSFAHRVDVFDYEVTTGTPTNRRTLVQVPAAEGNPDGMTVDTAGNLWVAFWGGWAARCFSPDGKLLAELPLPVANVTSCAFGGPDMADLYVTTASLGLTGEEREAQSHAGGLFRISPPTGGLPPHDFAG